MSNSIDNTQQTPSESFNQIYRIVASTNTCYYSENQVFGGVTIRVLCNKRGCYYSRVHKSSDSFFPKILEKPSIVQKKMIPHRNGLHFSMKWSKKKIQNGRLKKNSFSSSANSQYFFMKFSWIGPWVSRIDWCKGHWFVSTFVAVRLSDISSKTP